MNFERCRTLASGRPGGRYKAAFPICLGVCWRCGLASGRRYTSYEDAPWML